MDRRCRVVAPMVTAVTTGVLMLGAPVAGAVAPAEGVVFVNEIHYDNAGTDAGEAIEVAGPAGTDLTGWSIVLYNGNGGAALRHQDVERGDPEPAGRVRCGECRLPGQRHPERRPGRGRAGGGLVHGDPVPVL